MTGATAWRGARSAILRESLVEGNPLSHQSPVVGSGAPSLGRSMVRRTVGLSKSTSGSILRRDAVAARVRHGAHRALGAQHASLW